VFSHVKRKRAFAQSSSVSCVSLCVVQYLFLNEPDRGLFVHLPNSQDDVEDLMDLTVVFIEELEAWAVRDGDEAL
jgi:hypothetical protein